VAKAKGRPVIKQRCATWRYGLRRARGYSIRVALTYGSRAEGRGRSTTARPSLVIAARPSPHCASCRFRPSGEMVMACMAWVRPTATAGCARCEVSEATTSVAAGPGCRTCHASSLVHTGGRAATAATLPIPSKTPKSPLFIFRALSGRAQTGEGRQRTGPKGC
jgi:hypothetical protein